MKPITRRELIAAAASPLILASCDRGPAPVPSLVSVVNAPAYNGDLYDVVRRLFIEHKVPVKGKNVVLKPNLVEFDPNTPINTNSMVVHAALEAVRSLGAASVRIAEGPGHRRLTLDMAESAGYFSAIPKFEDIFTDLNVDDVSYRALRSPFSKLAGLYLPHTILGADLLVSLPKMKTHHWVGATLSMKNFFGLVPGAVYGWPKNVLHWAGIDQCVADLQQVAPPVFALVDGVVGMDGNGPIQGQPRPVGVLVAGRDMVAVDATCCRIMSIDPAKIGYLQLTGLDRRRIQQIGEDPASKRVRFDLIPQMRDRRLA